MIGAACNYRIPQANLHAVLNFVYAKNCSHYFIQILKFCLLKGTVVHNEQRITEKIVKVIKKESVFAFVNKFQRVTDYLLQQLQKLFEPI
jgi:hypothetical protein